MRLPVHQSVLFLRDLTIPALGQIRMDHVVAG